MEYQMLPRFTLFHATLQSNRSKNAHGCILYANTDDRRHRLTLATAAGTMNTAQIPATQSHVSPLGVDRLP
jgi:hypothetical protein